MSQQLTLDGTLRPTPQANRGRFLEDVFARTHGWYNCRRWGFVHRIPNAYEFVPEWKWRNAPAELRARTAKGQPLLRVKSGPDYVGGIAGFHVEFDAKEFAGASIPFTQFTPHQIQMLYDSHCAGNIAGFMVLEKRTLNVYWLRADFVQAWSLQIRRNEPGVRRSINFSTITTDERVRLVAPLTSIHCHYAPVLIPDFTERRNEQ